MGAEGAMEMEGTPHPAAAPRQRLLATARAAGALGPLERLAYWRSRLRYDRANRRFAARYPRRPMPPLWWMHDMYAHTSYRRYWRSGRADAEAVGALIAEHLGPGRWRVAEWGCGMGRVVRHLAKTHESRGFDYNPDAVRWCSENLRGAYAVNGLMPPLPAKDAGLDAVFAISVLTHLSAAAHAAWAAELARVVRPGGLVLLTVHGAPGPGQLLPDEAALFARGGIVVRGGVAEGGRTYAAYQPEAYMRRLLGEAGLEPLAPPRQALGQTLWAARRRSGASQLQTPRNRGQSAP